MSKNSENIEPPSNNLKTLNWFTKRIINLFSKKPENIVLDEEVSDASALEMNNVEFKSSLGAFIEKTVEDVMARQ